MAGAKISKDDLFDGRPLSEFITDAIAAGGAISSLNEVLLKLVKINKDLVNNNNVVDAKGYIDINKAIKEGNAAMLGSIKIKQAEADLDKKNIQNSNAKAKAIKEESKAREDSTQKTKEQAKAAKDLAILQDKEAGTLPKLRAENRLLTAEREKLNLKTEEGRTRLTQINAELDKNNLFIKHNSDALTKQRLNVGNYTESIKNALKQSGLFGESIEHITQISEKAAVFYELLHGAIETVTQALGFHTKATEEAIVANEANTAATVENTVAMEAGKLATEETTVALEAEVVATTEAEIATGRLTKALNFLKANPLLAIVAGLAVVATAIYETVTATQAGKDKFDQLKESIIEGTKAQVLQVFSLGNLGKGYLFAAAAAKGLAKEEQRLRDERISNIVIFAELEAKAAKARLDAEEENKTTQERIDLLKEVRKTQDELAEKRTEEAAAEFKLAKDRLALASRQGTAGAKEAKDVEEAAAKVISIETEKQSSQRRLLYRTRSLIEQDRQERITLQHAADKEEIDAIRITATERIDIINQTRNKELKAEDNAFKTKSENLTEQQRKLGSTTAEEQAQFQREEAAQLKLHNTNIFNINKKANEDLLKEEERIDEARQKEKERLLKVELDLLDQRLKAISKEFDETKKNTAATINADLEIMASKARVEAITAKTEDERKKAAIDAENAAFQSKLESIKLLGLTVEKGNELIQQAEAEHQAILNKITKDGENKRTQEITKSLSEITAAIGEELNKQEEIRSQEIDRSIEATQHSIDRQTELAAAGKSNQLAFEEGQLAKSELEKTDLLKKQAKEQQAIKLEETFITAFNASLNKDGDIGKALIQATEATAEVGAIAPAVAKLLVGGFHDGGYTGDGNEYDAAGIVHKGEFVHTKKKTEEHKELFQKIHTGAISDDQLHALNTGRLLPNYAIEMPIISMGESMGNSALLMQNTMLLENNRLLQKIADKPETSVHLDNIGNVIEERVSRGVKTRITKLSKPPRI